MRNISVEKSVLKKRLVYPINTEVILGYILMYFLALILPIASVLVYISDIQHNRNIVLPVYAIMVLIDVWMLAGIYYTNKLYFFYGKTFARSQNEIMSILKKHYPNTEFNIENTTVIRGEKEFGWFKMRSRIYTIIVTEEGIYVNILNTTNGLEFSSLQGVYNYFRSKTLAKDIYNNISIHDQIHANQL